MKHETHEMANAQSEAASVQLRPMRVLSGSEGALIKVDAAVLYRGELIVAGWAARDLPIRLELEGSSLDFTPSRFPRVDVNTHFGHPHKWETGFVFRIQSDDLESVVLVASEEQNWTLQVSPSETLGPDALAAMGPVAFEMVLDCGARKILDEWVKHAPLLPTDRMTAALDSCQAFASLGSMLLMGWCIIPADAIVWWDDGESYVAPFEISEWRVRDDVHAHFGQRFGTRARNSGFLALIHVPEVPKRLRLMARDSDGLHCLAEQEVRLLPADPSAVARTLFSIPASRVEQQKRFEEIECSLISSAIEVQRSSWASLPVTERVLGDPAPKPLTSIIVPLYGRLDFVEHQMIEWAKDPAVGDEVELIYVVDDPTLVDCFTVHAIELYRLYGVPFRWVWGGVNRGFSGANNLGASIARGATLVFLNSDAFPTRPGWVALTRDALESDSTVGAVGPRLLFADGGIQHAGMEIKWFEEFELWLNHHPWMGLPPELDPATKLTEVPAVTGACIMLRRSDFDAVGGWDVGYLIGDFEDSDLCLAIRQLGKSIYYLPDVELVHLERQSFGSIEGDEFRQRVTFWNARRHQARWGDRLRALANLPREVS